ncbi:MAG TPA: multicopper oxidase domain-containing protein [Acidimicrobiia bacterium]|nr:multicopper oxidase domain-containing protein [Acidimicrobiia bacterium]
MTEGVSRRELLKKVGLGGAVFLGGSVLGHTIQHQARAAETGEDYDPRAAEHATTGEDEAPGLYGHLYSPPTSMGPGDLDQHTIPPPRDGQPAGVIREIELAVEERLIEVGDGVLFQAWTYNGTVPAPIIRATEGDTLRIRFENRTGHPHNLHFHGAHRPEQDGWEPVPPGGETTYEIVAGPAGLHPYHCHTSPFAEHIGRGLYGMMIVDPVETRSPAYEIALLISGFSTETLGTNGVVAWNGVAGFYNSYPIKVPVGDPIRAYLVNMVEHEPVASFHLHAETFDVYPAGMGPAPTFRDDTIVLGQAQRVMIEFTLPHLGRYMFHPHQHWLAERGAMGWFAAI